MATEIRETETILVGNTYADGVAFAAFGPATHYTAAEVVDGDGRVVYRANEPADRKDRVEWSDDAEASFRATVRQVVRGTHEVDGLGDDLVLVFDPERDQATQETL